MELETLIVADGVSTPPDGKFYIHGGGISRVEVPQLPFPMPLGVLLRFRVDDDDLLRSHRIALVLIGPRGVPNVPGVEFDLAAPDDLPEAVAGEERFTNVGLQINAVAVLGGLYHLQVDLDGKRVRNVPIPVIVPSGVEAFPMPREWPQIAPPVAPRRGPQPAKRKPPQKHRRHR